MLFFINYLTCPITTNTWTKQHSQKGYCTAPNLAQHLSSLEFVSSFSFASKDGVVPQCKHNTNFSLPNAGNLLFCNFSMREVHPVISFSWKAGAGQTWIWQICQIYNLRFKGKRQLRRFDLSSLTRVFQVEGCQNNLFYLVVKCWR